MTGATMMPRPKMARAWPALARGKASSRIAWLNGTSGAPNTPWAKRKKTILSRFQDRPHSIDDMMKPVMESRSSRLRPSQLER